MTKRRITMAAVVLVVALGALVSGCARGGEEGTSVVPRKTISFTITFAGNIDPGSYYYVALDADNDDGLDGPVPIAAGPQWENGWGTGSFTHYVEYHLGQYELYRADLDPNLTNAAGGIERVSGLPDSTDAGKHELQITALDYGAMTVGGAGMIDSAQNDGFQVAGTFSIETDAAGNILAGGITWTPDTDGGRDLTAAEQAQLDALNTGGVALQQDSLAAFNITLVLDVPQAATQTLQVGRTTGEVQNVFTSASNNRTSTRMNTLYANSSTPTGDPPIPGATITTGDLLVGETAVVNLERAVTGTLIGPPYDATPPAGGDTLRFSIDTAKLGDGVDNLSFNIITTTELIFDPTITLPNENVYDGLGHLGNRYVTISLNEYDTITNDDGLFEREEAGDNTLEGPASDAEKNAVDIVDWSVTVQQLR
ncbi:MAG: hypothetical protein ACLFWB_06435 [Armatimonadota bacterium]